MAGKLMALGPLRAGVYSGRWQSVISGWSQLPADLTWPRAFQLGRADAETGSLPEAEKQLRLALRVLADWSNPATMAIIDPLSYELAQFYLARVLEQEGKKAAAVNHYQGFLSHFENSSARLPQIAEAKAALQRLM
jgi:tetratricopeptide (TPR) repeat protein